MQKYIGYCIVGTLVSFLTSIIFQPFQFLTALFAWSVPVFMWRTLGKSALKQALVLLSLGVTAIVFATIMGHFPGWNQIFYINVPLIAMFVAITFLTLTNKKLEDNDLPRGVLAATTTALGTHLLGAVINLSVLFVFGDRLQKNGKLTREQLVLLTRCFTAAAWWSPFFIATGVALTYAPDMVFKKTLVPGLSMAFVAICYCVVEVCFVRKATFSGYPIRFESLLIPVFLAGVVIAVHQLWHDFSILVLICIIAPFGALLFMQGRPRGQVIGDFVQYRILSVISQFAVFLAAGVFSTGLQAIIEVYPALLNLEGMHFSPIMFAIVLAIMLIVGILGVHPLISIAIASPLLLPLEPDHSQLAFMFLSSWAIGTSSSPLSGVGLALMSRYQISPRQIIQGNYHYAIIMWILASILNVFCFT